MTDAAPPFRSRVFLCGANMNPVAIRQRWAEARFVGLASAAGWLTRGLGLPPNAFGTTIWGIVVETGAYQRGTLLPITMRDGTATTAMLVGEAADIGALPDILAEARYWELPEAYRRAIEACIADQGVVTP